MSAAVILSGCSGPKGDPKPTSDPTIKTTAIPAAKTIPQVGDCLAKEVPDLDDFAPDYSTKVDCTKAHIYEVLAVVDVPKRFLKGKTAKEQVAQRDEYATVASSDELGIKLDEYAWPKCLDAEMKAAGLSKLEFNGKSVTEARATLYLRDAPSWLNMIDAGNWAEGNTKFLCTIRYSKHVDNGEYVDPEAIRSKSDVPSIQAFLTKDFPVERRQCLTRHTDGSIEPGACVKQHYAEMFLSFDAEAAFGSDFVKSIGPKTPTAKEQAKLNKPCIDALTTVLGKGYDGDLTAVADRGPEGWLEGSEYFPAYCLIVARDKGVELPGGSVIGDAKDVGLVPEEGQAA